MSDIDVPSDALDYYGGYPEAEYREVQQALLDRDVQRSHARGVRVGGDEYLHEIARRILKTRELEKQLQSMKKADEARQELVEVIKLTYRKHQMGDGRIAWKELGDKLLNALCNTLGDEEYQKWLTATAKEIDGGNFRRVQED